jgi:hypothetical protein
MSDLTIITCDTCDCDTAVARANGSIACRRCVCIGAIRAAEVSGSDICPCDCVDGDAARRAQHIEGERQ